MEKAQITQLLSEISAEQLQATVTYLAGEPLGLRKLNYTRPGADRSSLAEADDYLEGRLQQMGYSVEREAVQVQAYRCDTTKPKSAQYSPPMPEDPWYTAYNLYARKTGAELPNEIIVFTSHKDSQSWVDSPGANDNAIGTACNLELARVLSSAPLRRSVWFLFCNEEHSPWTSVTAAQGAAARGDNIVAVINLDSVARKSDEDHAAGRNINVTRYCTPEGERLAELMAVVNERYAIGLEQRKHESPGPGDDDGSFIRAGFPAAVCNIGSLPYADREYHTELDCVERVDFANAALTVKATLALLLTLDGE